MWRFSYLFRLISSAVLCVIGLSFMLSVSRSVMDTKVAKKVDLIHELNRNRRVMKKTDLPGLRKFFFCLSIRSDGIDSSALQV